MQKRLTYSSYPNPARLHSQSRSTKSYVDFAAPKPPAEIDWGISELFVRPEAPIVRLRLRLAPKLQITDDCLARARTWLRSSSHQMLLLEHVHPQKGGLRRLLVPLASNSIALPALPPEQRAR